MPSASLDFSVKTECRKCGERIDSVLANEYSYNFILLVTPGHVCPDEQKDEGEDDKVAE